MPMPRLNVTRHTGDNTYNKTSEQITNLQLKMGLGITLISYRSSYILEGFFTRPSTQRNSIFFCICKKVDNCIWI
ncbi:MAG: hypothetical protein DGJ47_000366 [Rickettsiaceae bacterium]